VLSVIPVVILVRYHVKKLEEDPQQLNDIQKKFFIGVAVSKIIPIALIITGMIVRATVSGDVNDLIIPWVLIGAVVVYGFYDISSQKSDHPDEQVRVAVITLITIARPLVFSVPIMSAIFLYMLTL